MNFYADIHTPSVYLSPHQVAIVVNHIMNTYPGASWPRRVSRVKVVYWAFDHRVRSLDCFEYGGVRARRLGSRSPALAGLDLDALLAAALADQDPAKHVKRYNEKRGI